jgi:GNAT superfamily N-acetyltransferase
MNTVASVDEIRLPGTQKCLVEGLSDDGTTVVLLRLIVREECRGCGFGRQAVREVQSLCRQAHKRYLTLTLDPESKRPEDLRRFYQGLGFRMRDPQDPQCDVMVCRL